MTPPLRVFNAPKSSPSCALECDIAAQCAAQILAQIKPGGAAMNDAELRGYVRARAHAAVRAAAVRAVARRALPAADEDAFIRRALERTVLAVIRHFDSPPVVTIPLPHVPVRSAA